MPMGTRLEIWIVRTACALIQAMPWAISSPVSSRCAHRSANVRSRFEASHARRLALAAPTFHQRREAVCPLDREIAATNLMGISDVHPGLLSQLAFCPQ